VIAAIYVLCFLVSAACAWLLLRAWSTTGAKLLLWTGIGFTGIALNNLILVIDSRVAADLSAWRGAPTLLGLIVMIWGLIEERNQ
jgi:Family of unknown function (DUF5985)